MAKTSQNRTAQGTGAFAFLPEDFFPFAFLAEEDAGFLVLLPLRTATL